MSKIDVVKWALTLGSEPQTFLGAKWISAFLKKLPASKKRIWALRILSLSPHYFINPDAPEFRGMGNEEYLETIFQVVFDSRIKIYEKVFKSYLRENFTVLDYGCVPGYLAKIAAPSVQKIYALDISTGAIACAKILNSAPNIEYVIADEKGIKSIPDGGIDVVFSLHVVQHLTREVFESYLETCRKKLKPNGLLLLHIQLTDDVWHTEEDWKADRSLLGKIRYRYDLHCFGRTEQDYFELVSKHGFEDIEFKNFGDFFEEEFEGIHSQRLLIARKK
jgi:SAM-dependent methyltransferase